MRLAWFRPAEPDPSQPLDDSAALVAELHATHDIAIVTEAAAHDFVWMYFRGRYDLCVFELDNTPAHQFIWPYLLHYGGVLMLRTLMLNESRAAALMRDGRGSDVRAEATFNRDWRMLRAPLLASRLAVVPHTVVAETLQQEHPEARVRCAPAGIREVQRVQEVQRVHEVGERAVTVGVLGADGRADLVERAFQRAREAGAPATLLRADGPERVLGEADVILALRWPAFGEPETAALAGMAAGKAVVVLETELSADWAALDPQTWQPRGLTGDKPVVVSIDPRDEEHSLMLAIGGLARDRPLREALGSAAREWWQRHATIRHAVEAWQQILAEASELEPPARPADWPPHLSADGTEAARAILRDIGVSVDFLR